MSIENTFGKWTDFQGGIRNPAFAAGGWIPAHMRGSTVNGAMHIADMYTTFCTLAGVADCSDDADGVPPVDGIDVTALFQQPGSPNTVVGNASSPRECKQVALVVVSALLLSVRSKLVHNHY